MRNSLRAAALASVAVLAAAGCSGTADPTTTGGAGPLAGQSLEVAGTWSGTEQESFQQVLDAFATKTGATVKYTSGGDDLAALINSRLAGGSPPDVALIPQPGVVNEFARKGAIKELTGEAATAVAANYSPAWQQLGTVDGKLYGVYFKVANKSVVWYRTDKFTEAGVQAPATWDDFVKVTKTLADAGISPMAVPGGDGWTLTDWFENVYLRVGGSENYDKLSRHEIAWTDPTVVQTLQLLGQYWGDAKAVQGGAKGAVQLKFTQSIADVFGEKPQSAMLFEGDFVAAEINKLGKVKVGEGAKFFDWPAVNGSKPAVVTAGDQAVAFKDSPAAQQLIAFLASPEAAKIMAAKGGFLSANKNLDTKSYPDPTTVALAESVVKADLLRFDLSDLTPQTFGGGTGASMWRLLQDFLTDPADPAGTAAKLEAAAKKDFGGK
ncbi:ABC transporter substrate-binding protein [Catellatospora chokoriensis]|uniref:Sugar ABC transporter substrate-binding protein n=1 Tax=Catellatospora chokoriensis TaxID=310353 RepID=A0A8J3JXH3_9ACTN|nr:ABC transporter substrate-binding protein [Catellatospora chokoriensis]GIF92886.1 sugar ABC transporter substrate-binding protein [Catellatospora chokoriensis]